MMESPTGRPLTSPKGMLNCGRPVVPAMQLGATDEIIEPAEFGIDVAVLKETIDGVDDEIKGQHLFGDTEKDERQHVADELQ